MIKIKPPNDNALIDLATNELATCLKKFPEDIHEITFSLHSRAAMSAAKGFHEKLRKTISISIVELTLELMGTTSLKEVVDALRIHIYASLNP